MLFMLYTLLLLVCHKTNKQLFSKQPIFVLGLLAVFKEKMQREAKSRLALQTAITHF